MESLKKGGGEPPDRTQPNNVYALRLEPRKPQPVGTVTVDAHEMARILARLTALELRQRRIEADGETLKTCCPVARNIFSTTAD